MQPRLVRRETADFLHLTLRLYVDQVDLHLDKQVCLKCDVCSLVCPKGAVSIIPGEEDLDITIDPRLCVLCEICSHFCPVRAVSLRYNQAPKTIFAEHQGLAPFYPGLEVDQGKCPEPCPTTPEGEVHWCRQQLQLVANVPEECPKNCRRCLDACPRQVFVLDEAAGLSLPQPDLCLRCTQCLTVCEYGSIQVTPQFNGRLVIDDQKCPSDCNKCINLCPVQAIAREGERVFWRLERCAYCGVCVNICDQEAVTLLREEIIAAPGAYSQAWDQAVARLLGR